MRRYYYWFLAVLCFVIWTAIPKRFEANSATVTTGHTFSTNELVTHTKLNNAINNATVGSIVSADITDGTIGNGDLGANAVTTDKVLDGTLTGSDLASRTIASSNVATNAITEIELNTNLTFRAGTLNFSSATLTFGAGQISAGSVASGTFITNGQISATTTYLPADVNSSTTYQTILTVTNGVTSGTRLVSANALFADDNASSSEAVSYARLLEVNLAGTVTNVIASSGRAQDSGGTYFDQSHSMPPVARTASATNIYILQGMDDVGGTGSKWRNAGTSVKSPNPAFSNATYITIMTLP